MKIYTKWHKFPILKTKCPPPPPANALLPLDLCFQYSQLQFFKAVSKTKSSENKC